MTVPEQILIRLSDEQFAKLQQTYGFHFDPDKRIRLRRRWSITHLAQDRMRVLSRACQGRECFDTPEDAYEWLEGWLLVNPLSTFVQLYGAQAVGTFRVTELACWPNGGDPVGCYWGNEPPANQCGTPGCPYPGEPKWCAACMVHDGEGVR